VRIAVVGTGIAGVTCVELLRRRHDVTVFEAEGRPGGHTHTVTVEVPEGPVPVDTGFLVYTERAYPYLTRLFARLQIPTQPADMSFSVSDEVTGIEWRGTSPATVFAQPRNLLRPGFWRMLVDIGRFNRAGRRLLAQLEAREASEAGGPGDPFGPTLAEFLATGHWSPGFVERYLVPIGSAIWSADPAHFLEMPTGTFAAFFARHGLLRFGDQAAWRTVTGGARRYVDAVLGPLERQGRLHLGCPVRAVRSTASGVELSTPKGPAHFDQVVVACHGEDALALLADASEDERQVLAAMRYQPNEALLHTDRRLLPRARRAWASWNYHRLADPPEAPTLTYDITRLQSLPTAERLLVTLNRSDAVDPARVLRRLHYAHPVVDRAQVAARAWQDRLNGRRGVWFCGAYWGDGFHEDGVRSALAVTRRLGGEEL
jgi:predicted NAD/FAD-binding protein